MNVSIDQALCTGDGLCQEIAPALFVLLNDGLSYVRDGERVMAAVAGNRDGLEGRATVPTAMAALAIEAAEECPGECIYLEEA